MTIGDPILYLSATGELIEGEYAGDTADGRVRIQVRTPAPRLIITSRAQIERVDAIRLGAERIALKHLDADLEELLREGLLKIVRDEQGTRRFSILGEHRS